MRTPLVFQRRVQWLAAIAAVLWSTDTTLSVAPKHHSGLLNTTGMTDEQRTELV
jgi:hypothetical protein